MNTGAIPRSVGVHDGHFHADEVMACALLVLFDLVDADKIIRSRDPEKLGSCEYVCDVGGIYDSSLKRFDHHQSDYQGDRSSAGMVLDYLQEIGKITADEQRIFRDTMVKGIDDHDNGRAAQMKGTQTLSHIVSNFSPVSYNSTPEEVDAAFRQAFDFAHQHVTRFWQRYQHVMSCRTTVDKAMRANSTYLEFEEPLPWLENFFALDGERHPALFVIMPTGEHWKLRAIPPSFADRMNVRLPLPEEWAGLLEGELEQVCGIPGAIFCHKGRFISVWQTREAAHQALEHILQKRSEQETS